MQVPLQEPQLIRVDPMGNFGPLSWLALLLWIFSLAVGLYLYRSWQERNPYRARFANRLGRGLAVLGAVGIAVLALKALGPAVDQTALEFVAWPLWGYLCALATLLLIGWAVWFYFGRLPQLLESTRLVARGVPAARVTRGARTYSTNGPRAVSAPPAPPRPVATTGRREARRDKKRKSR